MTYGGSEGAVRSLPPRAVRPAEREGPRTARRPLLAALSLVVVLVAMGGFAALYARAGSTTGVLVATRTIPPGAVIGPGDLAVAAVGGSGFHGIGAAYERDVLGQVAAAMIPAGALLAPGDVSLSLPAAGKKVVGVALHVGQAPAAGIEVGQYVDVVYAPSTGDGQATVTSGSSSAANAVLAPGADLASGVEVVDVVDPALSAQGNASGASTVVSLLVPANSAGTVAEAAATGSISLVLSSPAGSPAAATR